jgi:hypothetical protein
MTGVVEFGVEVTKHPTRGKLYTPTIFVELISDDKSEPPLRMEFSSDKSSADLEIAKEMMSIIKDVLAEPDMVGKVDEDNNVIKM